MWEYGRFFLDCWVDVVVCREASWSTVESVCSGGVHVRMTGTVTLGRRAGGRGLQNGERILIYGKGSEEVRVECP